MRNLRRRISLEKRWHKNRIFAGLHIIALAAVILAGCTQAGTDEHPVITEQDIERMTELLNSGDVMVTLSVENKR